MDEDQETIRRLSSVKGPIRAFAGSPALEMYSPRNYPDFKIRFIHSKFLLYQFQGLLIQVYIDGLLPKSEEDEVNGSQSVTVQNFRVSSPALPVPTSTSELEHLENRLCPTGDRMAANEVKGFTFPASLSLGVSPRLPIAAFTSVTRVLRHS